ncbi:hypothetical protein [Methylibium petroleiphilum]
MAGGIDWFRWHHGSVTDPKFQLVARRAGASLPDVLAVWAYLLETASASTVRGSFSDIDAEALDCLFNFPSTETRTADILAAMRERALIEGNTVVQWEKRQPKRERDTPAAGDGAPALTSTERSRNHRAKKAQAAPVDDAQRHATPCNATDGHETPRGEESREEQEPPPAAQVPPAKPKREKSAKTPMPIDFGISARVQAWAAQKGYDRLSEHLEAFKRKVAANGYRKVSWDDFFMEAVREDWAKLRGRAPNGAAPPPDRPLTSDAAEKTQAYLAERFTLTPEEQARADKARDEAMRRLGRKVAA